MAVDANTAFGPSRAGAVAADDRYIRAGVLSRGEGVNAETFPRHAMTGGSILVGGTGYYSAIALLQGETVSNITICVTTAGVAMTLSKLGLYTTAGGRLALSADQATAWESQGFKTAAMITPYVVPTSGVYYVAVIGAGGTLPFVARTALASPSISAMAIGSSAAICGSETAQTDLDPTATITVATTSFYHWAGVT